jgi:hypothetical protein
MRLNGIATWPTRCGCGCGEPFASDYLEVLRLKQAGFSNLEVAETLELSTQKIAAWLGTPRRYLHGHHARIQSAYWANYREQKRLKRKADQLERRAIAAEARRQGRLWASLRRKADRLEIRALQRAQRDAVKRELELKALIRKQERDAKRDARYLRRPRRAWFNDHMVRLDAPSFDKYDEAFGSRESVIADPATVEQNEGWSVGPLRSIDLGVLDRDLILSDLSVLWENAHHAAKEPLSYLVERLGVSMTVAQQVLQVAERLRTNPQGTLVLATEFAGSNQPVHGFAFGHGIGSKKKRHQKVERAEVKRMMGRSNRPEQKPRQKYRVKEMSG